MAENKKFTRLINSDGTKQAVALDMVSFDERTKKLTLYSSVDNTIKEETTIPASEVDATLSQSGLAADAKATGDAVKDVVKVGGTASGFTGIIVGTGEEEIELVEQKDFDAEIAKLNAKVGTPLVANTASAMVDTTKIYVYTGNENGYVNGNWYFYNGTNWESGGVYNAVAVQTDKTLTQKNKAADAKKTGDEISELKEDLSEVQSFNTAVLNKAVNYNAQFLLDSNRTTGYIRTTSGYDSYQASDSGAYWEGFFAPAGTYYYGSSISGARSYIKNVKTGTVVKLNTFSNPAVIPYDSIIYVSSNNYSSGSWFGTSSTSSNGEAGIYSIAENKQPVEVAYTFASSANEKHPYHLINGHAYKIVVDGDSTVAVNVRTGYGTTMVDTLATGCYGGHQYYVEYTGGDYYQLFIITTGACTVTITDMDAEQTERYNIVVNNVADFINAVNFSNTHKCTINMMPGTYDLIAGFGADYFTNAPSSNFGLILGNDVIINGSPTAKITADYTGDNANVKTYFSPFNAGMCVSPYQITGGFTLNDVWLSGSNIRYLVHDEHNADTVPYRNVYRNCYFYLDNSENTVWNNHQTIGGGLGVSGTIDITGCIFEGTPHDARTAVLGYHNCQYSEDAQSYINFCNNVLTPTNAIIYLGASGPSQHKTKVLLGNNLWGGVYSKNVSTHDNIDVIAWNNVALQ